MIIPYQILFSFSSDTKIEELTVGSDEKTQRSPAGIEPRVLRILVARSNHWATKPQRELREFSTFTKLSVLFHYEVHVTRIAQILSLSELKEENRPFA